MTSIDLPGKIDLPTNLNLKSWTKVPTLSAKNTTQLKTTFEFLGAPKKNTKATKNLVFREISKEKKTEETSQNYLKEFVGTFIANYKHFASY